MTTKSAERSNTGLAAIAKEMARQTDDALQTFSVERERAAAIATSIKATGRLLLLGMGASHAAARIVEPIYRDLAVDAFAIPLSEQLTAPVAIDDRTVIVTSQSGESGEVRHWFDEVGGRRDHVYGMTLDPDSGLARAVPSLVGVGGRDRGFAATRSLTLTLAMHLAVLAGLGVDPAAALDRLRAPVDCRPDEAVDAFVAVHAIVVSGRRLHGLAEALALGLTELSRVPAAAIEGGQFRHGPPEMLGPRVGVVLVRGDEAAISTIAATAQLARQAGSPVVVFDASGGAAVAGSINLRWPRAAGLAAALTMLPSAQRFMLRFAGTRVLDVGAPLHSAGIANTQ